MSEETIFGAGMTAENLNGGPEYSVIYLANKYHLLLHTNVARIPVFMIQALYEDDKWFLYQTAQGIVDREVVQATESLLTFKTKDLQYAFDRFKRCVEFFQSDQA